jgi:glycosyltransferase involved in cell wall biosynthesis
LDLSVLIPVYNAAATIRSTLHSVFEQTLTPAEIIVNDDGSTDETSSILASYGDKITVIRNENRGIGAARNLLCERAKGEILAFLDSDDQWHPQYLEVQNLLMTNYPEAVLSFTGHVDFDEQAESYGWDQESSNSENSVEVISGLNFFHQYNHSTGLFSPSFCCVSRRALQKLGREPCSRTAVAEDAYLFFQLALLGSVVCSKSILAAYRLRGNSLSSNRLSAFGSRLVTFELLEEYFNGSENPAFISAFRIAHAAARRKYAKFLMNAGRASEARAEIAKSFVNSQYPISLAKSVALYLLTLAPPGLQPAWPSPGRKANASQDK